MDITTGQYKAAPANLADGQMVVPVTDIKGRLVTVAVPPAPGAGASHFANYASVSAAPSAVAADLLAIAAINVNAAVRYLQLFDKAVIPVGGDVPVAEFVLNGGSAAAPTQLGIGNEYLNNFSFLVGIAYGISTTRGVYTAATAADHDVQGSYR